MASEVLPTPTAGPTGPSRNSRRRGPRRGGRAPNAPGAPNTNASPPAEVVPGAPAPAPAPASSGHSVESQASGANRGGTRIRRGGGGGGARGGARRGPQPMVNGQRTFGGQLTNESVASSIAGSLAGDAPVFIPGRPVLARARPPKPKARRMSKSQAPDIATRTHEDITNGQYECAICTNEVLPNSKIWSCKTCWAVLHISCVKKWSANEVSTHQQRAAENGDLPPPRQWRSPCCNLPKDKLPTDYTCWCEKETEPRAIAGLPPHSCGQTCSKPRLGHCPHPCELLCHAGPCPPCSHMGPSMSCFCGKDTISRRCVDTKYESGWSCGQVCGDILPCGEHACERGCHEGLCGSCDILVESRCFCGRVEKPLPCSERDDERDSHLAEDHWVGSFDCGAECNRSFDCGIPSHICEKSCHPQHDSPAHCPLSPDVVTHCPCGKTPLDILLPEPRDDCSVPVPRCQDKCEKELRCGHLCQQVCHQGDCRPCLQQSQISCRCGRTSSKSLCHQGQMEAPCCSRICRATLNCGRHECGERCCAGEKKASERQAAKRRHRPLTAGPAVDVIEAEHICLKVCGRQLKCGNHVCEELCHKGPCHSCLEAVFDEVSCNCGRTVLYPPQPCGIQPPSCNRNCTRPRTCGHPPSKHQCHGDAEPCVKCSYLVEKPCICGKRTLKNQPCWFTSPTCGLPCGKKLKCGIHFCQKQCHRAGECEDASSTCKQLCGRQKTVCEHACSDPCHAPYACKEIAPCPAKTFITCECQNQKKAVLCLASKSNEGNSKKVLDCHDECLQLQRNAKLRDALNIDPATHVDDHVPYSSTTLEIYQESTKFCQVYEREFRVFAGDEKEKRLRFKPMNARQRQFLHSLAEDFGLDSESQDPEPHRHVSIFKTPKFVSAPTKTLAQCVKPKPVAVVEPVSSSSRGLTGTAEPFNAFLLSNPRFGLTIEDVRAQLNPEFSAANLDFDVSFLPAGEIILQGVSSGSWHQKMDVILSSLKSGIVSKIKLYGLASTATLCTVDSSLNVIRKEDDHAGGGWSQVARGGFGGRAPERPAVGAKSSFTVLGTKAALKKKKEPEVVAEDWEQEAESLDA